MSQDLDKEPLRRRAVPMAMPSAIGTVLGVALGVATNNIPTGWRLALPWAQALAQPWSGAVARRVFDAPRGGGR